LTTRYRLVGHHWKEGRGVMAVGFKSIADVRKYMKFWHTEELEEQTVTIEEYDPASPDRSAIRTIKPLA
jgi:hypothetical protein